MNGTLQGEETTNRFAFTLTLPPGIPALTALVAATPVAVPPQRTPQPQPAPRTPESPGEREPTIAPTLPCGPALYRLQTVVRHSAGGRTLYDTFTLLVNAPTSQLANL